MFTQVGYYLLFNKMNYQECLNYQQKNVSKRQKLDNMELVQHELRVNLVASDEARRLSRLVRYRLRHLNSVFRHKSLSNYKNFDTK